MQKQRGFWSDTIFHHFLEFIFVPFTFSGINFRVSSCCGNRNIFPLQEKSLSFTPKFRNWNYHQWLGSSPCFQSGFTRDLPVTLASGYFLPSRRHLYGNRCSWAADLPSRGLCEGEKLIWTKRKQRQIYGHWHLLKAQGQTIHSLTSLSLECHDQDLCKFSLFSYSFPKHSVLSIILSICWFKTGTVILLLGRRLKKL